MKKYYTRVCNFYYGKKSIKLLNQKKTLPLKGNKEISFDRVEIISRDSIKSINIKNVKKLPNLLRKKIENDLKIIAKKNTNFSNFNFKKLPNIMGILNLTPDSFSDGGKFNNKKQGLNHALHLLKSGADIIDIGGESTRPGSKSINKEKEWNRIKDILKDSNKKFPISVDTRKSDIMNKSVKFGVKLINDVSGLDYDHQTIEILKKFNIPFVIQHSQGNPEIMQRNPKYKNVLLDVYDFF